MPAPTLVAISTERRSFTSGFQPQTCWLTTRQGTWTARIGRRTLGQRPHRIRRLAVAIVVDHDLDAVEAALRRHAEGQLGVREERRGRQDDLRRHGRRGYGAERNAGQRPSP